MQTHFVVSAVDNLRIWTPWSVSKITILLSLSFISVMNVSIHIKSFFWIIKSKITADDRNIYVEKEMEKCLNIKV